MGRETGKIGGIDGLQCLSNCQVDQSAQVVTDVHSDSLGGPAGDFGNQDWTGRADASGHTPLRWPNDTFGFGMTGDGATGKTGSAIVMAVDINFPIKAATPITHTYSFGGIGEIVNDAVTFGAASTSGTASAKDIKVQVKELGSTGSYANIPNVTDCRISLKSDVPNTVTSDTDGWNDRKAGNLSGTISVSVQEANSALLPEPGKWYSMRIVTSGSTEGYQISYVSPSRESKIVPIGRSEFINGTLEFAWAGLIGAPGATTVGQFVAPDDTTVWP
jgi:hypothetical protein